MREKFMAIDVGLKRIGLAFGFGEIVTPLEPVLRKNRNQAARDVSQKVNEYAPDTLVVGVPIGGSSEDEMIQHNRSKVPWLAPHSDRKKQPDSP